MHGTRALIEHFLIAKTLWRIEVIRYAVISIGLFILYRFVLTKWADRRRVQGKRTPLNEIKKELLFALPTIAVFSLVSALPFDSSLRAYSRIYTDPFHYGSAYLAASAIFLFFFYDTYFYWTHRALHKFSWLRRVHAVHHSSRNPSPLATHLFHPVEAVIHAVWAVPIMFIVPIHFEVLTVFNVTTVLISASAHSGVEIFPAWMQKHRILGYIQPVSIHNQHHQHGHKNYGLYFLWWDRWMGTYRDYRLTPARTMTNNNEIP